MNCEICGRKLKNNQPFCPTCGARTVENADYDAEYVNSAPALSLTKRCMAFVPLILATAGIILSITYFLVLINGDTEYIGMLIRSNIVMYVLALVLPILLLIIANTAKTTGWARPLFAVSVIILILQGIWNVLGLFFGWNWFGTYLVLTLLRLPVPGSSLLASLSDFFSGVYGSWASVLSNLCFIAKTIICIVFCAKA